MDALSDEFTGQIPLWVELGYRFPWGLTIGSYVQAGYPFVNESGPGLAGAVCHSADISSCSGASSARIGVELLYSFLPAARLQPWAGLGAGYEWTSYTLKDSSGGEVDVTYGGWELLNIQLGADYMLTPTFGIGPYVAFSLAQYGTVDLKSGGQSFGIDIASQKLHEWLQLGVRATFWL